MRVNEVEICLWCLGKALLSSDEGARKNDPREHVVSAELLRAHICSGKMDKSGSKADRITKANEDVVELAFHF